MIDRLRDNFAHAVGCVCFSQIRQAKVSTLGHFILLLHRPLTPKVLHQT